MAEAVIVHPTDLGYASEAAFFHALKLGLASHAHLSLVHFHDFATESAPRLDAFPHVRDTLTQWGLLPSGAPQSAVSEQLGLYLSKGEFEAVDPERGLAHLLHDQRADFVVLGTRGLHGMQRLFDHSFSEELARDAHIPTLFVPEGARGFVDRDTGRVRLENVLIPVTKDPDPAAAVNAAARLCTLLGQDARLHLLHVGDAEEMPSVPSPAGVPTTQTVREGPIVDSIVEVAEEVGADLIVMATAGHKDFMDALRGSTTEEVLRKARRPLLAVPVGAPPPKQKQPARDAPGKTAVPPTAP